MKTYLWLKDSILVIGLATIMTIILTFPAFPQDTLKKSPKTTVKIKIIKEDNGKKTVLDTTITSSKSMDSREIDEIIANLDDNMKGLDEGMKELNISLDQMKAPDSAMMDSIKKITAHVRVMMDKNFRSPHSRWNSHPGAFEYNFDFDTPEPPEPPEPPEARGEHHHHFDYHVEPFDMEPPMGRGDGSLMDLLHNIPMDQIKSFNIKEKKDGTKITIEVGRGPALGYPHSSQRTIIIRPDRGEAPGSHHDSDRHKRVIIKSDKEDIDEL